MHAYVSHFFKHLPFIQSLPIIRNMQRSFSSKHAVIYAPSLGRLWVEHNLVPRALFPGFGGGEKRPGDEVG